MSKKNQNRNGALIGLLLVASLSVGALSVYAGRSPANKVPAEARRTERLPEHQGDKSANKAKEGQVSVPQPEYDKDGNRTFNNISRPVPAGQDKYQFALNTYLESTKITSNAARVTSASLQGDTLVVTFSPEIMGGYGSEDESTLINGLLLTAGQFDEVQKMVFKIGDDEIDSLGHVEIANPMPVQRN